jgi:DNA-binding NarL/FixJ family response regulator
MSDANRHLAGPRAEQGAFDPNDVAEIEVLGLVGHGLTNTEIAERLVVSIFTAKTHVSHILTKLDLRDRSQLVIAAYESGLVVPGSGPS